MCNDTPATYARRGLKKKRICKDILPTSTIQVHDSNATWFSCTMCKYKCKKPNTLTRHYASKHEVVVSEKEPDNNSKMKAPDKETKIAQNKKHHHKGDTSIIQETLFKKIRRHKTLFKKNSENTKSIEFVNTHTTNCNDSMTPSREQDTHIEQGSNYNATKDQDKFYTHETSPQNIHNYCVQQDSNFLATKHLKIIAKED